MAAYIYSCEICMWYTFYLHIRFSSCFVDVHGYVAPIYIVEKRHILSKVKIPVNVTPEVIPIKPI